MVRVYAPASSANMSVGFDVLGAAVTPVDGSLLGDVVSVEAADQFSLNNLGRFANKLPSEPRENIVYQCWERFCQELGKTVPVAMTLEKNMPIGSGLGSSACSVVAALVAMNEHCGKPLNDTRLLAIMGELEGRISGSIHYDNVAPCFLGGMQLMIEENGIISQQVPGFDEWLWVLMGIGFIASMLHLGSPMRAFNSLNRVGASALSNEIASGSVFFAIGGIGWLLAMLKKMPPALRNLWLVVTMVLGVVFVWMMVRVYNTIDTVPTWYSVWTPLGFFLTMFMGGPLLGYLLLRIAGVDGWAMRLLPAISVLALVVSAIMSVMQGAELATIHSSVQQASALVPDYGSLMAWRIVALALALCCWIVPQVKGYQPAVPLLSVAFILLLVGELIGRGVFYGLHMTVGMAVAS